MQGGILGWIILAAATITALGVIWRKAVKPVVKGIEKLVDVIGPDDQGRTVPDRLNVLERKVDVIDERSKQLEPNGGNSLYDRVGKLEQGQANAMRQQQTFTKKLTPMVETIALLSTPPRRTAPRPKKKEQ